MKTKIFLMMAILAMTFSSCMNDYGYYSADEYKLSLGNVEKTSGSDYRVALDNGSFLYPSVGHSTGRWFDDGQRIIINYTILGDKSANDAKKEYYVRVNDAEKVLTKKVIPIYESMEDSIGNNPIVVRDAWIGDKYLNFELNFYGDYKTHMINLVKPEVAEDENNGTIRLELRHNSYSDVHRYRYYAIVSFDLTSLQVDGSDEVKFVVTSKDYNDEEKSFDGVYKYGDNRAESKTTGIIGGKEHFSTDDTPTGKYQ